MAECMTNCSERPIAATDKQIDQLVYELYGLTGDEIRIVEGGQMKKQETADCRLGYRRV